MASNLLKLFEMLRRLLILLFLLTHCAPSLQHNSTESLDNEISNQDKNQSELRIITINVGQGASTLITSPLGKNILIDAGPEEAAFDTIFDLFQSLAISKIDFLFTTHYDADHIAALPPLSLGRDQKANSSDDIKFVQIFDRGSEKTNELDAYLDYQETFSGQRQRFFAGDQIEIEENLSLRALLSVGKRLDQEQWPIDELNENDLGIVYLISYKNFHYLNTGDISGAGFRDLPDMESFFLEAYQTSNANQKIDVFQVSHHGSESSSQTSFIQKLNPQLAIMSVGNHNPYGHPNRNVLGRFVRENIPVYQTNQGSTDGGLLDQIIALDDHIFIFVDENGDFEVNGDFYQSK